MDGSKVDGLNGIRMIGWGNRQKKKSVRRFDNSTIISFFFYFLLLPPWQCQLKHSFDRC